MDELICHPTNPDDHRLMLGFLRQPNLPGSHLVTRNSEETVKSPLAQETKLLR